MPTVSMALFLALFGASGATAQPPDSFRNEAVKSDLWARDIILLPLNPGGGHYGLENWGTDKIRWLVAARDADGKAKDFLFDGFLIVGPRTKRGTVLQPLYTLPPASATDWEDALTAWLDCAANLSAAFLEADQEMNAPGREAKVILGVPYPDIRNTVFGPIQGKQLDLSNDVDRARAVEWYVDLTIRRWEEYAKAGKLGGARLVGFYWSRESLRKDPEKGNDDLWVVRQFASCVRKRGYLSHWIPGYRAGTLEARAAGLDCITAQTNYQNPGMPPRPLSIFEEIDAAVAPLRMDGMEMNPISREYGLNLRVYSPYEVWLANLDAALRLNWKRFSTITYFDGADIPPVAANLATHIYYEKLCKWVHRTLTAEDCQELSGLVIEDLIARGALDAERAKQVARAKTVLEKLQLMERPEEVWKHMKPAPQID